jgi:hypothetical protein
VSSLAKSSMPFTFFGPGKKPDKRAAKHLLSKKPGVIATVHLYTEQINR